jgi:hypothetical protein
VEEVFTKHLEFVQNIINRMSNNSFLLKGWNVTVSSAILALIIGNPNPLFAIVALLSSLSFWGLDAYYLRQERLFRSLYDDLRVSATAKETKKVEVFSLDTDKYEAQVPSWFRTLWSKSIFWLHGIVIAVVILIVIALLVSP